MEHLTEHFEWSPDMALGIPEMDVAHRAFMEHLADLIDAPEARFNIEFPELVKQIEEDFHEEERLMEAIEFPALMAHREQHARVLSGLHHVLSQVQAGNSEAGKKAIDLLAQWFTFHLMTMDTALAYALDLARSPESGIPAAEIDSERTSPLPALRRVRTDA